MNEAIDRAVIDERGIDSLPDILAGARTVDVRYAVKRVVSVTEDEERLLEMAEEWSEHPDSAVRQLACGLAEEGYRGDRKRAVTVLRELADDSESSVRDAVGKTCGRILVRDFSHMHNELCDFRVDPSPRVRRVTAIAAMIAGREKRMEWAEPLLKLLEPLLVDRDPEVRRSLGPLAIGSGLLRDHPDMTFEYLVKWSTSNDEQVLWNVAMSFSGTGGPPLVKKALIVLRRLSLDERRYVWRAVASAMWKLGRKRPEIVRPELARWLEDERRVEVARAALKYL